MAKILPSTLTTTKQIPPGEKAIYRMLAEDPTIPDWTIIFRQEVSALGQRDGELDFLVLAPELGVLVLEIKSHRSIKREGGLWYLGADPPTSESPFRVLNDKRYKLKRWIKENAGKNYIAPPVARLLVFTNTNLPESIRSLPEFLKHEIADASELLRHGIVNLIRNAFEGNEKHLSSIGINDILTSVSLNSIRRLELLMCPDFVGIESSGIRRAYRDSELVQLVKQQYAVIRAARKMPRLLVEGYAGTGKTNLAIHAARELRSEGYKVGLFCYNNNLGDHLKYLTRNDDFSWVGTVDAFARVVARPKTIPGSVPDFATIRADALLHLRESQPVTFDAVVIDEAQDLYMDHNLELVDIIDAALTKGLVSGTYRMFADFESQQFLARRGGSSSVANRSLVSGSPTVLELHTNCRNPRLVGRIAASTAGLNPGYDAYLREGGADSVRLINSETRKDQVEQLSTILSELKETGVAPSEIVILSMCPAKNSTAQELAKQSRAAFRLQEYQYGDPEERKSVQFCSVAQFKGLESPTVIITDVDDAQHGWRDEFYCGMTRALDRCVIMLPGRVRDELLEGSNV